MSGLLFEVTWNREFWETGISLAIFLQQQMANLCKSKAYQFLDLNFVGEFYSHKTASKMLTTNSANLK